MRPLFQYLTHRAFPSPKPTGFIQYQDACKY
jgi:hypothetical protein